MSGRIASGIGLAFLVVPISMIMGANSPPLKPRQSTAPPTPRNPGPMPPGGPLRFAHTSLEDCEASIEWVDLPPLADGSLWQVSADAAWRADAGLERFRPTPCWRDAQIFADSIGAQFVTVEMSDSAWRSGEVKLAPHPLDISTGDMMGQDFAIHENGLIEQDRAGRTGLIATVGKDYVDNPRNSKGRATIYGWHQLNGAYIQMVSNVHEDTYHDYSHHGRYARRK